MIVATKIFESFILVLGTKSVDIFNYFGVDNLHGLSKKAALEYKETSKDAYIMGLTNYSPIDEKPFIFINTNRLNGSIKDGTAIMHETVHLGLLLNNWKIETKEEKIVSDAERIANQILDFINEKKVL
jgi:hypothetical protein